MMEDERKEITDSTVLEQLKWVCEDATPGPWYAVHGDDWMCAGTVFVSTEKSRIADPCRCADKVVAVTLYQAERCASHASGLYKEDAVFIAVARQALPALIELCEAQERLIECMRTTLEKNCVTEMYMDTEFGSASASIYEAQKKLQVSLGRREIAQPAAGSIMKSVPHSVFRKMNKKRWMT